MKKRGGRLLLCICIALFLIPAVSIQAAKKKTTKAEDPLSGLSLATFRLRSIGPALTSGRISDFAVNPGKRSEFYVATSSGGVWKSENAGTTFKPIFDGQGSYSIGCISMDPNNSNIIWVGTGENNNQRSVAYGDGVYKSIDGGASWKHMGLKKSEHIGMITIDPRDSNVIYVAAYGPLWSAGGDRGLYKSVDGGKNWTAVLTISDHTGISEVHFDPRNPDILYAVAHQRRRHVFTLIDGGPESGIYKSSDAGNNWQKINRGLPGGDRGRIGLDISPADPEIIYAIVEAQRGRGGFFRSRNGGASWEKRSSFSTSGNYYQEIVCDPVDPDRVVSLNTFSMVSDDGGLNFTQLGERSKHWDNHALWIDPEDPDYYLQGSDGGVYESFDRGSTWKYMANLPVTQFYKVAVDNNSPFYHVYGGTQDNYSLGGPSRTTSLHGIVNSDWYITQGGDGFESQVDPEDANIVYAQSQHGNLVRYDKRSGEGTGIQPKPRKGEKSYRWNWDAPLLISPHSHTRIYFAANKVFRSDDRGNTWRIISDDLTRQIDRNKLEVMGRVWPMDAVAKNASTSQYGTIVALDESPVQEDLIYIGTDDGLIQVSEDGGKNWLKVENFPGVPQRTYVNDIIASKHARNTVYAAFNNHKNGDFKPYILKSTDAGKSWATISANLPDRGSVYALAEDHVKADLLFAGTEFGLFVSLNGGKFWHRLKNGLPTVAVRDLAIQERENDLVLGTFGRGFYVLDNYAPMRELSPETLAKNGAILPVKDALMFVEKTPLGTLGSRNSGFQGESYYSVPNPPITAVFTYYLKDGVQTLRQKRQQAEQKAVKEKRAVPYPSYEQLKAEQDEETPFLLFTISDENNQVIRQLRAPVRKGLNRMTWDLRYPALNPSSAAGARPNASGGSSTFVLPGTYRVSLSKSVKGELTPLAGPVAFKAIALGHVTLPAEDRAELVSFQNRVRKLNHSVMGASSLLRELNTRIQHYRAALKSVTKPHGEIPGLIKSLAAKLAGIQIKLSGDATMRRADRDAVPGVSTRIRGIISGQWKSSSAPTRTQRNAYRIAEEAFIPIYDSLKKILSVDVKQIEKKLDEIGAPYTPGRLPDWK